MSLRERPHQRASSSRSREIYRDLTEKGDLCSERLKDVLKGSAL